MCIQTEKREKEMTKEYVYIIRNMINDAQVPSPVFNNMVDAHNWRMNKDETGEFMSNTWVDWVEVK